MTQFRRFAESVTNSKLENSFRTTRNRITFFVGALLALILFLSGINSFHQHKYIFEQSRPYQLSAKISLQPIDTLPASIREDIINFENKKGWYLSEMADKIFFNNLLLWFLLTLLTWLSLYYLLKPLQDAIYEKEKFLDSASHELRTPLAVMKSELSFIDEETEKDEVLETIDTVKMQVNKLAVLSDTLLNRLEGKKDLANINLRKVVEKTFKTLGKNKGVLNNNIDKKQNQTLNGALFEQLIYNILDNALKYSDPKKINATSNENGILISNPVKSNFYFSPGVGVGVQKELAKALNIDLIHWVKNDGFNVEIKFN